MSQVNDMNLDAHYSTSATVERTRKAVAAPKIAQSHNIIDYKIANSKWKRLCDDIYEGTKKEKNKSGTVLDYIFWVGVAFLGVVGVKRLIKFFKKS